MWEPRRTAGPSAALRSGRDDKWWVVTFIKGRQIGWTEKTQQAPSLTSHLVLLAGLGCEYFVYCAGWAATLD